MAFMAERDINNLNAHSVIVFEEIVGEPETVRSIDCSWKNSKPIFLGSSNCCYKLLSAFCAIPAAVCWGFQFACLTWSMVWCYTPNVRYLEIWLSTMQKIFGMCIHCFCDPIWESMGTCFNNIRVEKIAK